MSAAVVREQVHDLTVRGRALRMRALHFGRPSPSARRFLLLHGNPASAEDFERLGPLLGEDGEAVAPDLPGFGETEALPAPAPGSELGAAADTCGALFEALGWRTPVTIVGHSHGGAVAQVVAGRFPASVARLVLLASLGYPAHLSYRLLAAPFAGEILAASAGALSQNRLQLAKRGLLLLVGKVGFWPDQASPAWLERFARFLGRPSGVRFMAALAAEDPSEELARNASSIRCPVLVLHGDSDRVVPLRYAQGLSGVLERAGVEVDLQVIAGSGHMLTHRNAEDVARRIRVACGANGAARG